MVSSLTLHLQLRLFAFTFTFTFRYGNGSWGLFRCGDAGTAGEDSCVAPATCDYSTRITKYIEEIAKAMDALCKESNGSTPAENMRKTKEFFQARQTSGRPRVIAASRKWRTNNRLFTRMRRYGHTTRYLAGIPHDTWLAYHTILGGHTTRYLAGIPHDTWRAYHTILGGHTTRYLAGIPHDTWRAYHTILGGHTTRYLAGIPHDTWLAYHTILGC